MSEGTTGTRRHLRMPAPAGPDPVSGPLTGFDTLLDPLDLDPLDHREPAPAGVSAGGPPGTALADDVELTVVLEPVRSRRRGSGGSAAVPAAAAQGTVQGTAQEGVQEGATAPAPRTLAASLGLPLSRRQGLLAGAGTAVAAGAGIAYALTHRSDVTATPTAATDPTGTRSATSTASGSATGPGAAAPSGSAPPGKAATASSPVVLAANLDPEHLLRRAGYGPNQEQRAQLESLGAAGWLTAQLTPKSIPDPGGDAITRLYPEHALSASAAYARYDNGGDNYAYQLSLSVAHLGRAIWSNRQLYEVMVDFWSNHLNITCPGDKAGATRVSYDRDVIRAFALGRFEDMLLASAVHPAMLAYLDNANSTGQEPNENYARELMELHTVGVNGGYTERDVKQAAVLLTGWELKDGRAVYTPSRHRAGTVKVMTFRDPNPTRSGGRDAQQRLLRYLANHPSTARFLARKLAVRFVSDAPSDALVTRLAAVYTAQKTAVVPVLKELFASAEFAAAEGLKLRRPFEHLVATARALGVRPGEDRNGLQDLYWTLDGSGHKPLAWPMPNGYPDVAVSWQSPAAALNQFNVATAMTHGWWPNKLTLPGGKKLLSTKPHSAGAVVDAVAAKLIGRKPTTVERDAALRLLAATKLQRSFGNGSWDQEESIALVASLLLQSPAHLVR